MASRGSLLPVYPAYVASRVVSKGVHLPVVDKFTNEVACHVVAGDEAMIGEAFAAAAAARPAMQALPSFERKDILQRIVEGISSRKESLANALVVEVGKTINDARVEVERATTVFEVSAEEATRQHGDYMKMDITARNAGFSGITSRFPAGVVSMIAPFNFPLNLAAHKVGPAIAAGCPFVLKPSERTPISSQILGEILMESGLPEGSFSVVPCFDKHAPAFSADPHINCISFTGSPQVGWHIQQEARQKKVLLELGGNAACILDRGIDVAEAVNRVVFGAFYQSGQSCISVQRVYAHEDIYEEVRQQLREAVPKLVMGDPMDTSVFLGPLISEKDAVRCETMVDGAVSNGASVLVGGVRDNCFYDATVVEGVKADDNLNRKEVFGPVCTLQPFSRFSEACDLVNDSEFGLQAGVFTPSMDNAFYAFNHIEAGGVVIGDVPSVRVDSQPYGGVKSSGVGREGVVYAIEDFTEPRIMLMKNVGENTR